MDESELHVAYVMHLLFERCVAIVVDCDTCFHVDCWQSLLKRSSRSTVELCSRSASAYTRTDTSHEPTVSNNSNNNSNKTIN